MKKVVLIASLFGSLTIFSQENKMQFTDKLVYENNGVIENDKISAEMYLSKSGVLLRLDELSGFPSYYDNQEGKAYYVTVGLGNKINLNKYLSYYLFYDDGGEQKEGQKEEIIRKITNTNKQETIGNNKCTVYQLDYFFQVEGKADETPYLTKKICVDEKNTINNVPYFLSSGSPIGGFYLPKVAANTTIKGLVLKLENREDTNPLILKTAEKINETAYFDFKKEKEEVKKYAEEQKNVAEKYVAEGSDEAAVAVPEDSKNAAEATEEAARMSEYGESVPKYESTYKQAGNSDFAIDNLENQKLWNGLPKYCRKIDDAMPNFENKDLKNHLKNYVGQMCDMYLTQYEHHNVAIKETLDQIRKESLYLDETRKNLNKKDTEKLDQFLKNLD